MLSRRNLEENFLNEAISIKRLPERLKGLINNAVGEMIKANYWRTQQCGQTLSANECIHTVIRTS